MGGNAIKKVFVSRINVCEYKQVKQVIIDTFSSIIQIDFAYDKPGKESYGDLDVLYIHPGTNLNLKEEIIKLFNPVEIVTNGLVISWAYKYSEDKYFQIDMVKCINIPMCKFYYSYGDLGNIVGRMTKFYGLKFGHEGLSVNFPNLEPIMLTSEPKLICEYLDLDYNHWVQGFELEEEIFKWIANTDKLFSPNIFLSQEESNYEHRHKTQTRPMYGNWIKWLEEQNFDRNIPRQDLSMDALEYFNKIGIYNELIKLREKREMLKRKFNGSKLIKLGINEKIIGQSIIKFKSWIENSQKINFDQWVEVTDEQKIDENILKYFS